MIVYRWIRPHGWSRFVECEPESGVLCETLPVWDRGGHAVDRVAWRIGAPAPWRTLRGAVPVLGLPTVLEREADRLPLFVAATPASWYAARRRGQTGAAVLDWDAAPGVLFDELRRCESYTCESAALAERLGAVLASTPFRRPAIRALVPA